MKIEKNLCRKMGSDQYEECYTEEELNAFNELEIRLSNHNFGGNEFISYRKDCVNCVFNF